VRGYQTLLSSLSLASLVETDVAEKPEVIAVELLQTIANLPVRGARMVAEFSFGVESPSVRAFSAARD
jgi:hypothetical protein